MLASFGGPHKVDKHIFVLKDFLFLLHISFGLSRPLRTALELKNYTVYSEKSAGCDCANGECYYLAKNVPKTSKYFSNISPNSKKSKMANLGC